LKWLLRVLLHISSTNGTGLAHVCDLTVEAWPEHTVAGMAKCKFGSAMSCKEFVEETCAKRRGDDDAILFKSNPS